MNAVKLLKILNNKSLKKKFDEEVEKIAMQLIFQALKDPEITPTDGFEENAFAILKLRKLELEGLIKQGDIKSRRMACEEWVKREYGYLNNWTIIPRDKLSKDFVRYMKKQSYSTHGDIWTEEYRQSHFHGTSPYTDP